jgi:hypothetical protein
MSAKAHINRCTTGHQRCSIFWVWLPTAQKHQESRPRSFRMSSGTHKCSRKTTPGQAVSSGADKRAGAQSLSLRPLQRQGGDLDSGRDPNGGRPTQARFWLEWGCFDLLNSVIPTRTDHHKAMICGVEAPALADVTQLRGAGDRVGTGRHEDTKERQGESVQPRTPHSPTH